MFAAIFASLVITPFSIGHIDRHGNEPHSAKVAFTGHHIAVDLPPRTALTDLSGKRFLYSARVDHIRPRWSDEHTVEHFGRVTFDGITFTNLDYHHWHNVYATIQ